MWKQYADAIADTVKVTVLGISVLGDILVRIFVFTVLLITCPVWIIPYIIRRENVPQNQQETTEILENTTDNSTSK